MGVLTGNGGVLVLTRCTKGASKAPDETTTAAYVLRHFKEGADKSSWSKQYISAGERPYTGGYVWGIPPPLYARSGIQCLLWLGDRLLVCPEAMEPIRCLNPDTGTEIWQVDRLWEFQRGFIGPSVWSHFINRFGIGDFDRRKPLDEERKAFDQQYRCALVGGPVVMPLDFDRGNDTHSIFVTAVKGPAGAWSGYLSECLLYELGDDGKVISVVTLPRIVDGSRTFSRPDGVVWKCQKETFVKARPAQSTPEAAMGGGGADGVANLAWARRVQYREPQAWFHSGKAGDPVAFGGSHAFCLPGGGYVSREGEMIYRFPMAAVDLSSGVDALFVLNVPFNGTFSIPTSNIGSETASDGTKTYRTSLFHLLAITQLAAEGQELEITIATENQRYGLKFDLTTVLKAKLAALTEPVTDTKQAARARAKRVDPKQINEALQDAAHGTDIDFLKATLEAGGDPKYSSSVGWTALMVAAAYGTAEMVDLLIAAGSNVNAADQNCGGQTVLMWAARSGREAKRKIRSLLKAGADPKGTSVGGYNALMSAASSGDVEAVECLLQAGLSVSVHDRDDGTVLMAGARSGKANIITVLIAAGSNVNAKDNQGTTALMRAAQSYDSAAAVEALLKAGANPNARDRSGRTALQIAEKSNNSRADEVVALLKPVTTAK
jgi:ankyrin repeat protein